MLLVGAFVGRPGGLIALGIVASLGLGITSAVEASTDWETGGETLTVRPDQRRSRCRTSTPCPTAQITLDLTGVRDVAALDGREIDVHLNAGEIDVTLPRGRQRRSSTPTCASPATSASTASHRGGFDQSLTRTITGSTDPNAPTITLDLDARVGQITVDQD